LNKNRNTRNLIQFFLIAFGFSWLFWVSEILVTKGFLYDSILARFLQSPYNPAAFGPFVAAFLLTYQNDGIDGMIKLLKRGVNFRFRKIWFIVVLPTAHSS